MQRMLYYIAESILGNGNGIFNTQLIARFETRQEAVKFCYDAVAEWQSQGLNAFCTYDKDVRHNPEQLEDAEVWGAEALDEEYTVKHLYHIFATPIFMGGGLIG